MENINYNIFHLDNFTNSYPYTMENVGITYIMYYNNINFISRFFDNEKSVQYIQICINNIIVHIN